MRARRQEQQKPEQAKQAQRAILAERYRKIEANLQGLQKEAGNIAQKPIPSDETGASLNNFKPGVEVAAHSLNATELNGLRGIVMSIRGNGRVEVRFSEEHASKALKPDNLKLTKPDDSFAVTNRQLAQALPLSCEASSVRGGI